MSKKIQLPSRARKSEQPDYSDAGIVSLARKWAELHANKKTREKMDELLAPMPENVRRKVYLCGQRISQGLAPKVASDYEKQEWKLDDKTRYPTRTFFTVTAGKETHNETTDHN